MICTYPSAGSNLSGAEMSNKYPVCSKCGKRHRPDGGNPIDHYKLKLEKIHEHHLPKIRRRTPPNKLVVAKDGKEDKHNLGFIALLIAMIILGLVFYAYTR